MDVDLAGKPPISGFGRLTGFIVWLNVVQAQAIEPSSSYTRPHQLVDVGHGRRINLFCVGSGEPAVLLDAGFGSTTLTWRKVQGSVAEFTRACSYDRAGYGFSDPAIRPSDARNAVDDLHALIAASLHKPVILVGHSEAGLYDTLYAKIYPGDLAGLVLVDPHFPQYERQIYDKQSSSEKVKQREMTQTFLSTAKRCVAQARAGQLSDSKMKNSPCLAADGHLDPILLKEWHRQAAGVAYEAANLSEAESVASRDPDGSSLDDDEALAEGTSLHDLPIRILIEAPDHPFPGVTPSTMTTMLDLEWRDARDLAAQSTQGSVVGIPHSTHLIQDENPAAVIAAVKSLVK